MESTRRWPISKAFQWLLALVITSGLVLVVAIPVAVLRTDHWDPAQKAGVIQGSSSIYGALVGGIALCAAVIAYEESQRRPRLRLWIRNSQNALRFRLENVGTVPATNPRVVLRFSGHPYVRMTDTDAKGGGRDSAQWRVFERVAGGAWYRRVTWIPPTSSSVIHPDLTLETPVLHFPASPVVGARRRAERPLGQQVPEPYDVPFVITWTADRAAVKTERVTVRFPSAPDDSYL